MARKPKRWTDAANGTQLRILAEIERRLADMDSLEIVACLRAVAEAATAEVALNPAADDNEPAPRPARRRPAPAAPAAPPAAPTPSKATTPAPMASKAAAPVVAPAAPVPAAPRRIFAPIATTKKDPTP